MEIMGITGVADEGALNAGPNLWESKEMGEDEFLKLLTVQMANQDPLDPMSNEQFVAQLAQFSSLEQLVGMNAGMESLYMGMASMNNATMANLVGKEVVAAGNGVVYDGESQEVDLHYHSGGDATSGTITIYDEDGSVVYTSEIGSFDEGEGHYTWNGKDTDGNQLPAGNYTFEVTGTNSDGGRVEVLELVVGLVDEMDYSSGSPMPTVQGIDLAIGDILRLTNGGL